MRLRFAEEAYPLFLGEGKRHHWNLPHQAATPRNSEDKANSFRQVATSFRTRIGKLVAEHNGKDGQTLLETRVQLES